jgi:hypothetical protein
MLPITISGCESWTSASTPHAIAIATNSRTRAARARAVGAIGEEHDQVERRDPAALERGGEARARVAQPIADRGEHEPDRRGSREPRLDREQVAVDRPLREQRDADQQHEDADAHHRVAAEQEVARGGERALGERRTARRRGTRWRGRAISTRSGRRAVWDRSRRRGAGRRSGSCSGHLGAARRRSARSRSSASIRRSSRVSDPSIAAARRDAGRSPANSMPSVRPRARPTRSAEQPALTRASAQPRATPDVRRYRLTVLMLAPSHRDVGLREAENALAPDLAVRE